MRFPSFQISRVLVLPLAWKAAPACFINTAQPTLDEKPPLFSGTTALWRASLSTVWINCTNKLFAFVSENKLQGMGGESIIKGKNKNSLFHRIVFEFCLVTPNNLRTFVWACCQRIAPLQRVISIIARSQRIFVSDWMVCTRWDVFVTIDSKRSSLAITENKLIIWKQDF